MSKLDLDQLFTRIHNAVLNANENVRLQQTTAFEGYFDKEHKPITIPLDVPVVTEQGIQYQRVDVPKLTLTPMTTLKVKEVNIEFKVRLTKDTANSIPIDIPHTLKDTDNLAHVQIKLEGSDPAEGILKINDRLLKSLP